MKAKMFTKTSRNGDMMIRGLLLGLCYAFDAIIQSGPPTDDPIALYEASVEFLLHLRRDYTNRYHLKQKLVVNFLGGDSLVQLSQRGEEFVEKVCDVLFSDAFPKEGFHKYDPQDPPQSTNS